MNHIVTTMLTAEISLPDMSTNNQLQLPPDWAFLQDLSPEELEHLLYGMSFKRCIVHCIHNIIVSILMADFLM